jgi:polyisoprenyl-teichoic acid--peptidoglycan teichoic acid transferase
MPRSTFSAIIGAALGILVVMAAVCMISLLNPGWLGAARPALSGALTPALGASPQPNPNDEELPAPPPTRLGPAAPTPTLAPLPTSPDAACGGPERMTIALLGVDSREATYTRPTRTDAIILLTVNFRTRTASLLSFPRDLYVPLPNLTDYGIDQSRLNTAYLYGEIYGVPGGGPAELKDTIALNFAINVDRYVMVNFGAFEAAVDALGGIDVDVPTTIYDPEYPTADGGTMLLEIPVGLQHMDGQTALRYARTRHQDDDYHRIQRQQIVLLAIRDKLLSPAVIPQIPALLQSMSNLAQTDLAPQEIAALACIGPQIDRSTIIAQAIDGTMVIPWTTPTGGRVSIPNRDVIAPIVARFLGQ